MASATSPPAFDLKQLELLFGPMILGVFCELWFLGIIVAQVCAYRSRYPGDPVHLKLLVATVSGGQLIKVCLNIKIIYKDFTFGQFKELGESVPWIVLVLPIIGQFPVLASQAYLCFRIWVVSGRKLVPTAIGVAVTMLQLSLNLAYVIRHIIIRRLGPQSGNQISRMMPPWAFSNAAADMYLSFTLAYYLLQTRKQSLSHRLDYILVRLASLAITTCLPPACISVVVALLELLETRILVWVFFGEILGSMYALCILHARKSSITATVIFDSKENLSEKSIYHHTSSVISRESLVQKASLCASARSSRYTPNTRLPSTLSVRFDATKASVGRRSERNIERSMTNA
ncbi:BQ2448_6428 [Microbotryum intermedium]|uniref:BQ2448_6428 protein n=1 Tax=Microbotryum intermedium TaxID=269621 RepID=A0A238FRZ8_9BASI|nr:BQ2448_6428 [Microbotryum intermedium]